LQNEESGTDLVPRIEERDSMAERGTIGKATFEQVTALVTDGMTRSAAFAKVAEESERTPATVATAFYRVAREMPDGGGVRQRPRKRRSLETAAAAPKRGPGRPRRAPATDVDELLAAAHRAIDALGSHLRALDPEARDLRENGARIDQIRSLLG
jgi:hypothetical protein